MLSKPRSSLLRAAGLLFILLGALALKRAHSSCYDEIVRVPNATGYGRVQGIIEFPIADITYLHEVPNPKRTDHPPNFIEQLMEKIKIEGFQEKYAVPLLRMPDGIVYCMGHHRTEAMKRLGQRTVPAFIYDWNTLSPSTRDLAMREFPSVFMKYK